MKGSVVMSVTLEAKYLGYHDGEGYWVNVRNANPTGKIGDGGVIRRFETKEEAKEYAKEVNATGIDTFIHTQNTNNNPNVRHVGDEFISSEKISKTKNDSEATEVSFIRATTGYLTQEQVDNINKTRKLPDNLKIISPYLGGYLLQYNSDIDLGPRSTQTVPEGYELKRNIAGYVNVVPINK